MRSAVFLLALTGACSVVARAPAPTPSGSRSDTVDIVVASTTDVHGWLRGWDYLANAPDTLRGLSRAATILDSVRSANAGRVVLVDAGDILQGTAITSVAVRDSLSRNPMMAAMNAMGYDAAVVGNHEFNYGLGYLRRAVRQASFPFLAANVYAPDGTHAFRPWVTLTRAGIKVAIVGGTTPGSMIWDRDKLRGRVDVRDLVPSVRDAVSEARANGADVVVVALHSGLSEASSYDTVATGLPSENVSARIAREVPGIDLLVFGHTHKELPDTVIGSTLVTQPRNWSGSVSLARLRLHRENGLWHVAGRSARVIRARGHAENARVVAAIADAHARTIAYVTAPIGTTPGTWRGDSARLRDTPILDFVLEVERRTAGTDLAAAAAFNPSAHFGPGNVTMADMVEIYPYESNVLRAVKISGRQLREYLEFSARYYRAAENGVPITDSSIPGFNFDVVQGVDYVIDLTKPIGARITTLSRNGRAVADADTFTMALNDYRQVGGGGYAMLRGAPVVYDQQQQIRQLVVDEVQRRGVVRPEDYFIDNWRLVTK